MKIDKPCRCSGLAWSGMESSAERGSGVIHVTGYCCQEFGGCLVQGTCEPDKNEP